ncbi:hypothetical protein ACFL5Q_02725 [Planctomycetota bacterium]
MLKSLPLLPLLLGFCPLPHASAHYLWVTIDDRAGESGTARIVFEESPSAGDGHYLDHFAGTSKTWVRCVEQIEPRLVQTSDIRRGNRRWFEVKLPVGTSRSVDCYGKFGVYSYGKTKVLLHYYARHLDVRTHAGLHELGRAEHMDLDIVPHDSEAEVEVTVLWKGKAAAGRLVYIRGPKQFRKNIKTGEKGHVRFTPAAAGSYTFRTSVEEASPGREGDEDYALIRHNCTLIMELPLEK